MQKFDTAERRVDHFRFIVTVRQGDSQTQSRANAVTARENRVGHRLHELGRTGGAGRMVHEIMQRGFDTKIWIHAGLDARCQFILSLVSVS